MNNNNVAMSKKIIEGLILSLEIMVIFMALHTIFYMAIIMGCATAYALKAGDSYDYDMAINFLTETLMNGRGMTVMLVVTTAISAAFSVTAYWIIWGRRRTAQDKQYLKDHILKARPIAMIIIGSIGLYYLAILISAIIGVVSPETLDNYNELMELSLGGSEALAIIAAVILAPFNEECIMRGLILRNLQKYFSVPVCIVIQAVLFGIFHGNWVQGFYVLPVGAALGYVAIKSRSVIPCIFMHLFYNLFSFIVVLLPEFCQTGIFTIIAIVVSSSAVLIMGMWNRI